MNILKTISLSLITLSFLIACSNGPQHPSLNGNQGADDSKGDPNTKDTDPTSNDPNDSPDDQGSDPKDPDSKDPPLALACKIDASIVYKGIGGDNLAAGRTAGAEGENTYQMKPADSLRETYMKTFGQVPPSFARLRGTITSDQPRWVSPVLPSAFSNYAVFMLGREVGQSVVAKDASWAQKISPDAVLEGCKAIATKAWIRTVTDKDVEPCVRYMESSDMQRLDPAERWSYAFAAVLSSIEFISY